MISQKPKTDDKPEKGCYNGEKPKAASDTIFKLKDTASQLGGEAPAKAQKGSFYTDSQLKTLIQGIEAFDMRSIMKEFDQEIVLEMP